MLPNASDIQSFLEVTKTKNISRAAERLGLTQPALSQSIKRLENAFGQQFFIRGKGGVKLTRAFEKFTIRKTFSQIFRLNMSYLPSRLS